MTPLRAILENWTEIATGARDIVVAESVMGYRFWKERRGECELCVAVGPTEREPWMGTQNPERNNARYTPAGGLDALKIGFFGSGVPNFTTNPSADYESLCFVRDNWQDVASMMYLPGDWSYCALSVLSSTQETNQ